MLLMLLVGVGVYYPGLHGGYVFDDVANLLRNAAMAPDAVRQHFWAAVFSGEAGPLARPLSMLSFALQIRATGFDPLPLKLVNLALHLGNGWMLWLLGVRVAGWCERTSTRPWAWSSRTVATAVAAAWLVAPINLTGVLYVIQREEALASTFVLLGLLAYWHGRMRLIEGAPGAWRWIWGGLAGGTVLAALAKETGVMLPAYAAVLEWAVLRGAGDRDARRGLATVFTVVLLLPGLAGLAMLLPSALDGSAYAARPFTLDQRLLTEMRVLVDYLHWILVPDANVLSLYHDDIALSTGWMAPWTTATSALLLAALTVAAFALRRRQPLFALGVGWFLIGQSLVSSFVPLELVYEHRNYLPSWGVLLAVMGPLGAWAPRREAAQGTWRTLSAGLAGLLIAVSAFNTAIRSAVWGDPARLAYFEATLDPASPRASYELGWIWLRLAQGKDDPRFSFGMRQMEVAARVPGCGLDPLQGLVIAAATHGLPIQPEWWAGMRDQLRQRVPSKDDVSALYTLVQCGMDESGCHYTPADRSNLAALLSDAVRANPGRADLLTLKANEEANVEHDMPAAYRDMLAALAMDPQNRQYWMNVVATQIAAGLTQPARVGIERLRELDPYGLHRAAIRALEVRLKAAEASARGDAQ